ncbi:Telomere-associated protein RIF1 [Bagarius yarrelli]|uniref:Telomere-associated protein RIF1 n=1 Tax=Bagarius yarrelli TaxID=175774 RepID=A0A556U4T3_BAGYA|nr:Telomere-associated protein RIF1 [Bagarius yarrelli]
MMATVPMSSTSLLPLLGTLEDDAAGVSEQTDAYLTIANRLSGEDGRQFFPLIVKHFSCLGKAFQSHISSENEELSQAALQALGFCVFNTHIVSSISGKPLSKVTEANFAEEILLSLCAVVLKSTDKNTCTRALWVISKQNFPAEVVAKKTPEILKTLEALQTKDIQSVLTDHESLNVVIKLLEQAPVPMGDGAVSWIKLVIPLVVHTASKVRLRAAAALEMGMPLLLEKQQQVAAIVEPMMSSKLIPEMQKLFSTKNESNVLKLWPLFVKLLGKLLHKGGAFINSLLYLEELGFRSSSPSIKKIAFLAWKSLIDNFALNPDILCSSKRLKLLMQPLSSILVRTESLLLTKLEVWWYLVVKLGPNLSANFEPVGVPLLLSTISSDASLVSSATPAKSTSQSNGVGLVTPKAGVSSCSSPGVSSRLSLNSSVSTPQTYTSIQLLGLEMLLHYFLGTQASAAAAKSSLQLSLESLTHNLITSHSFFSKHSSTLISAVRVGKRLHNCQHCPDALLSLIWTSLVGHVNTTIEAAGNKKERQGSEVLTLLLQALQSIVSSEALPVPRALLLLEATVKAIPQKVLGSAAYQVANMDVLNGTPALFLILLLCESRMLSSFVTDERFFVCLETLVSCGLCGPTSPLAFGESVLGTVSSRMDAVENKEHLWRMWSIVVNPLTDTITQTNEVNQGDALEHNFSAIHSALMFPVTHLLSGSGLSQMTQKTMLSTWSRLYKAFARCSALVATAEENVCCEELCARISSALDGEALKSLSTLDAVVNFLLSVIENVDFSPFTPQFQQKMKSPHTPLGWVRKRNKALGNLSTFHALLVQSLEVIRILVSSGENGSVLSGIGTMLFSVVSILFANLALPTVIQESLASITKPLALLYDQVGNSEGEHSKTHTVLASKMEKLVGDVLGTLQTRSTLQFDDELLEVLSPLLCVFFQQKSKHIRSVVTQFWNATFGNALLLTYPDSLSGMLVTSVRKRDSLLPKAAELKERSSKTPSKPVKLDFGSPKPPRKDVLEEEASVDFVFIPPEAKERVLTEHQKEVKRTKRVDIPVMYNNLDASLDTTAFTQYTQSQEESTDKMSIQEHAETKETCMTNVKEKTASDQNMHDTVSPDAQDGATNGINQATEAPSFLDVTASSVGELQDSASHKESQSPNVSGSSDMISGTPPKPSSRRQSFITLEKYEEGRPANLSTVTTFTGPLARTSCSQESSQKDLTLPSPSKYSQHSETSREECVANIVQDSTNQAIKNLEIKAELKSVVKSPSEGTDDDDDVIPDTQTHKLKGTADTGNKSLDSSGKEVKIETSSPGEKSEVFVDSHSSVEPRRSCRRRSRPVLPGEESDQDTKNNKKAPVSTATINDAQKSTLAQKTDILPTRTRRSRVHEENMNESGNLKNSEQKESQPQSLASVTTSSSQRSSRNKDVNKTEPFIEKQCPSSQTDDKLESPISQSDSQSNGRPGRRTRLNKANADVSDKRQSVQNTQGDSPAGYSSASDADSQSPARPKRGRRSEAAEAQNKDKPGLKNKQVSDPCHAQTPETPAKGKSGRGKRTGVEQSNIQNCNTPTGSINSEFSQSNDSELQDNSQGRAKYRTRRSSQALLASVESSESDASNTQDRQRAKRIRVHKSSELTPDSVVNENTFGSMSGKKDSPSVPMDVSENEPEACLVDSSLNNVKAADKIEAKGSDVQANAHYTSEVKATDEQQSDENPKMQTDSEKEELVSTPQGDGPFGNETLSSSQNSQQLLGKVEVKTLRKCPHGKKGRGRRRSNNCNCLQVSSTPLKEECSNSQNLKKNPLLLVSSSLPPEADLKSITSVSPEGESAAVQDEHPDVHNVQSSQSLSNLTEAAEPAAHPLANPAEPAANPRRTQRRTQRSLREPEPGGEPQREPGAAKRHLPNLEANPEANPENLNPAHPPRRTQRRRTRRGGPQRSLNPANPEAEPRGACGEPAGEPGGGPRGACGEPAGEPEPANPERPAADPEEPAANPEADPEEPAANPEANPQEPAANPEADPEEPAANPEADPEEPAANPEANPEEPAANPEEKHTESFSQFVDAKEDLHQAEEQHKDIAEVMENKNEGKDPTVYSDNKSRQEQPQKVLGAPDVSSSPDQSMDNNQIYHKQSESPVSQEEMVNGEERTAMPELKCATTTSSEDNYLNRFPQENEADEEATQIDNDCCEASLPPPTASAEAFLDSPPKQRFSDSLSRNTEVRQSPSNSVTRGVWSPLASPSTSILKKGQKRQCEEDSPSPLIKSRRVSFANPIYQQELADDIDRRSPVIRTSSPKSKVVGQSKYITTPTKGLLPLSPRNLRSPGYRSSKKCLISELSQEPRPIPKDCVYPPLVCCSTPVEAVLPQISSSMWPRGFGQLVRARNIKTVGDLSALSPSEIKLLPIRSPKMSNLKKALKTYHEQQRKGRPDDLKSFDEMEKMTSEPEETPVAANQEEDQMSGDGQGIPDRLAV